LTGISLRVIDIALPSACITNSPAYFQVRDGGRSYRLPVHRAAAVLVTSVCNVKASGKLTMGERVLRVGANSRQGFMAIPYRCGLSTALAVLGYRAANGIPSDL
jgi:hypothetical protein